MIGWLVSKGRRGGCKEEFENCNWREAVGKQEKDDDGGWLSDDGGGGSRGEAVRGSRQLFKRLAGRHISAKL